jgi:hypothetical protein
VLQLLPSCTTARGAACSVRLLKLLLLPRCSAVRVCSTCSCCPQCAAQPAHALALGTNCCCCCAPKQQQKAVPQSNPCPHAIQSTTATPPPPCPPPPTHNSPLPTHAPTHLCQVLHALRLDVHNVEGLVLPAQQERSGTHSSSSSGVRQWQVSRQQVGDAKSVQRCMHQLPCSALEGCPQTTCSTSRAS